MRRSPRGTAENDGTYYYRGIRRMVRANRNVILGIPALLVIGGTAAFILQGTGRETPGELGDGRSLVTTNQVVSPIGIVRKLDGARPKDLAISPDGTMVAVLATSRVAFFRMDGTPEGEIGIQAGALGIAWNPDGKTVYASAENGTIHQIERTEAGWKRIAETKVTIERSSRLINPPDNPQVNGLAVSPPRRRLHG